MATLQWKTVSKQQRVMHMAHLLYKNEQRLSCVSTLHPDWSRAVRDAWSIQYVRDALLSGVVKLRYITQICGNEVERAGTLCGDIIPAGAAPNGRLREEIQQGLREPVWNTVNYYDLTVKGWRSFDITNLVDVERMSYELSLNYSETGEQLYRSSAVIR